MHVYIYIYVYIYVSYVIYIYIGVYMYTIWGCGLEFRVAWDSADSRTRWVCPLP